MCIRDRLQAVEDRYEELGELLSDPDVVSDTKRFMELSKEEASTRDTVTAYREYKQVLQNIVDAEEMIKEAGGDADLEEMAKQELKDAKAEKEEYEEKLKILLLPKDPNDDKNIILEIRGAAGGDEAQLFAGDLLQMYQKYAESQGWRFEIMDWDGGAVPEEVCGGVRSAIPEPAESGGRGQAVGEVLPWYFLLNQIVTYNNPSPQSHQVFVRQFV